MTSNSEVTFSRFQAGSDDVVQKSASGKVKRENFPYRKCGTNFELNDPDCSIRVSEVGIQSDSLDRSSQNSRQTDCRISERSDMQVETCISLGK